MKIVKYIGKFISWDQENNMPGQLCKCMGVKAEVKFYNLISNRILHKNLMATTLGSILRRKYSKFFYEFRRLEHINTSCKQTRSHTIPLEWKFWTELRWVTPRDHLPHNLPHKKWTWMESTLRPMSDVPQTSQSSVIVTGTSSSWSESQSLVCTISTNKKNLLLDIVPVKKSFNHPSKVNNSAMLLEAGMDLAPIQTQTQSHS